LLPTPTAFDSHIDESRAPTDREGWEAWKADRTSRGVATGQGMLADAAGRIAAGHADQLLPTPTTGEDRKSQRALTASTGNGRRTGGGQSSPLGLGDVAGLLAGERPANLPPDEQLPPATRRQVGALLPSPTAALAAGGQTSRSGDRQDELLLSGIAEAAAAGDLVLPTPTSRDWKGRGAPLGRDRDGRPRTVGDETLPDTLARLAGHPDAQVEGVPLLNTPTASDGKRTAVSDRARDRYGATTLGEQVEKLLPTPEASDGSGGRVTAEEGGQRPSRAKRAITLATALHHGITAQVEDEPTEDEGLAGNEPCPTCGDAVFIHDAGGFCAGACGGSCTDPTWGRPALADGALFPTPRATRGGSGTETMYALGAERADEHRPQGEVLLPTPTCQDGSNTGGPSQFERNSLPLNALAVALGDEARQELLPTPRATDGEKGGPNQRGSSGDLMLPSAVTALAPPDEDRMLPTPIAGDAMGARNATCYRGSGAGNNNSGTTLTDVAWQAAGVTGVASEPPPYTPITDWGPYAAAVARWAAIVGPAPAPTEPNAKGKQRLSPAFPEWMMGLPRGWVTEVPGITRNEMLKAIGNGVVPQQGYVAITRQLAAIPW